MGNSINSVIIITIEMITCRMLYESFVVRKKNITDKVYNMSMVILIGVMFIISRTLKTYIPVKLLAGMIAIVIYMYIMIPGAKGLNPHELAHRWVKDLVTHSLI